MTEEGHGGWGHWVCFVANKCEGQIEFILMDSENRAVLDCRTESILNATTNEPGLKALLRDELAAVDQLIQCFLGKVDMANTIADKLVDTKIRLFNEHMEETQMKAALQAAIQTVETYMPDALAGPLSMVRPTTATCRRLLCSPLNLLCSPLCSPSALQPPKPFQLATILKR